MVTPKEEYQKLKNKFSQSSQSSNSFLKNMSDKIQEDWFDEEGNIKQDQVENIKKFTMQFVEDVTNQQNELNFATRELRTLKKMYIDYHSENE